MEGYVCCIINCILRFFIDIISLVISFNTKASGEEHKKHKDFVNRMISKGYTEKQVRLLCEWYLRVRKSS